jgi:hypothetical protein
VKQTWEFLIKVKIFSKRTLVAANQIAQTGIIKPPALPV